ncbi:Non-specific lipid-transfer protein [Melia azedarach]|uniref:Non-specific lipid-transfer protein n=2 Tax=Melia azedarach TaxID=155640 RepID=A0ACC1WZA7_MELAZ|nr:Non-specific lipid-transfer protein [Melia azedarach]KAJ4704258.1 Non-specific lipid-transfer protein [Melia azedarach]
MASSAVILKLACFLLAASALIMAKADITCQQVVSDLTPCISYVSNGGAVPVNCCNGVRTLYGAAQTTVDRQNVCKCLKSAVSGISYTGFNLGLAAGLPSKCGLNIPYKISPSTDCNRVQ